MPIVTRRKKRRRIPVRPPRPRKTQEESKPSDIPESMIDETIAESFPASDPPSWTTGREKSVDPENPGDQGQRGRK